MLLCGVPLEESDHALGQLNGTQGGLVFLLKTDGTDEMNGKLFVVFPEDAKHGVQIFGLRVNELTLTAGELFGAFNLFFI